MSAFSDVSAKDIQGSLYKLVPDDEIDIELRECFKKIQSLDIHLADILDLFQLKTSSRVSEVEYLIGKCPQCLADNTFRVIYQRGDYPKIMCSECHCERTKGNCFISLIQLFCSLSRNEIMGKLKAKISNTIARRNNSDKSTYAQRLEFAKKHGIYPATAKKTKGK